MDETYDSGVGDKFHKLDETHDGVLYAPSGRLEIGFVFGFWFVVHIETVWRRTTTPQGPGGGAL